MVKKIAILTDSSSSIYNMKYDYDNLFMIDIPCFIGEEMFKDFKKNTDKVFYEALASTKLIAKTSQPSVGETLEKFEEIKALGFTDILYLPISKELSGTYANGFASLDMITGINIDIVDTKTTVSILGGMALFAAKLAKEGKSLEEIKTKVLALIAKSAYYATVNDLTALIKNGRLSSVKGKIANLLKIKPVIILNSEGKLESLENVRTFKSSIKKAVDYCLEALDKETGVIHLSYARNHEALVFAREYILSILPNVEIEEYTIASTVVAHIGLDAIGVGYINY